MLPNIWSAEGFLPVCCDTYLDFVRLDKLRIGVDVVDALVSQRHPVAPVQRADVVVDGRLHRLPVVVNWSWMKWVKSVKQSGISRVAVG